jgi:hypothetical protein
MAFFERSLNLSGACVCGTNANESRLHARRHARAHLRFTLLLLMALGTVWLFAPAAHAQASDKHPVTFRTLALNTHIEGLYYDQRGAPVSVSAGATGLSMPYEVPVGGRIVFYRLIPSPVPSEPRPRRVNVAEVNMTGDGPFLVFMGKSPGTDEIAIQVSDDSWEIHPLETIRVFSFSRRNLMVKIANITADLNPTKDKLFSYVPSGQFWLQAATKDPAGWEIRVSAPQVAPPRARITAIFFDQQPSVDRPVTHELQLVKFIDVGPQPPTP